MLAPLNVRLDEDLVARVKARSESSGVPQARIVRDALEEWLEGVDGPRLDPDRPVVPQMVEVQKERNRVQRQVMDAKAVISEPVDTRPYFRCPDGHNHVARVPGVRCKHCNAKLVADG